MASGCETECGDRTISVIIRCYIVPGWMELCSGVLLKSFNTPTTGRVSPWLNVMVLPRISSADFNPNFFTSVSFTISSRDVSTRIEEAACRQAHTESIEVAGICRQCPYTEGLSIRLMIEGKVPVPAPGGDLVTWSISWRQPCPANCSIRVFR